MEIKTTSEAGVQFLIKEEGIVKRPYLDSAGIPTIGCGFTYYPTTGKKVSMSDPALTTEAIIYMLRLILKPFELAVYSSTRDDINQNEFDANSSIAYNIGTGAYRKSTLVKRVNANPSDFTGITAAFCSWRYVTVKGLKKPLLLPRRKREAALYSTPVKNIKIVHADQVYAEQVKHIQHQLGLTEDGIFGAGTKSAVITFQKANKLIADGVVGPRTLEILNAT